MSGKSGKTRNGKTAKPRLKNPASSPEFFQTAWFITVFVAAAIAVISQARSAPGSVAKTLDADSDPRMQYSDRVDDDKLADASAAPNKQPAQERAKGRANARTRQ